FSRSRSRSWAMTCLRSYRAQCETSGRAWIMRAIGGRVSPKYNGPDAVVLLPARTPMADFSSITTCVTWPQAAEADGQRIGWHGASAATTLKTGRSPPSETVLVNRTGRSVFQERYSRVETKPMGYRCAREWKAGRTASIHPNFHSTKVFETCSGAGSDPAP